MKMNDPIGWFLLGFIGFGIGFMLGARSERKAWTMRALGKNVWNSTPHHCEGEFYYVITEKHFCEEYQRRHKEID